MLKNRVAIITGGTRGIGYETAKNAKKRNLFVERKDGEMALRRGYKLEKGEKVVIIKPTTYMNLSGEAIVEIIKAFIEDDEYEAFMNSTQTPITDTGELIEDIHKRKPSYGYHRVNAVIKREVGLVVSDNLVHKVCKILNIKSKAKHYKYKKHGEESIKYENIIGYNWNTSRPFEKVVSDTTSFWFKKKKYDWTFYLDVFNNEIIGFDVSDSMHGNGAHRLAHISSPIALLCGRRWGRGHLIILNMR